MKHTGPPADGHGPQRVQVQVLIRNEDGDILLLKPTGHDGSRYGWRLPGAAVHAGELVSDAAARGLRQETGIVRRLTRVVAVDQVLGDSGSLVAIVLDGGLLTGTPADIVHVPDDAAGHLPACRWVPVKQVRDRCWENDERRIAAAHDAAGELGQDVPGLPMLLLGAAAI